MSDTDDFAEDAEPVEAETQDAEEYSDDVADEAEDENPTTDDSDDDAEADEADAEPEYKTIKYGGKEYEVPPELEDGFMIKSEFTQKTQSLAEQRKAVEAQQAHLQQQEQMRSVNFQQAAEVSAMDQRLNQYNQIDWVQLNQEDPVEAQRLDFERRGLQQQRDVASQRLQQQVDQASAHQADAIRKTAERTRSELKAEIDGWSDELEENMAQFAISEGINEQQLRTTVDKATLKILHKAYQYDQILKQRAAKGKVKPKPTPAKPAAKIKGRKQGVAKNPDQMSVKEWTAWREAQIAKKAG